MDVKNFIDSVASGNAVEAKESLNDLLSSRAFEAIDAKKVELAQSLFAYNEVETKDTEATAEE